jgi:hypothetical protein
VGRYAFYPAVIAAGLLLALRRIFVDGDVGGGVAELAIGVALIAIIEVSWRRAGRFRT